MKLIKDDMENFFSTLFRQTFQSANLYFGRLITLLKRRTVFSQVVSKKGNLPETIWISDIPPLFLKISLRLKLTVRTSIIKKLGYIAFFGLLWGLKIPKLKGVSTIFYYKFIKKFEKSCFFFVTLIALKYWMGSFS